MNKIKTHFDKSELKAVSLGARMAKAGFEPMDNPYPIGDIADCWNRGFDLYKTLGLMSVTFTEMEHIDIHA